MCRLCGPHDDQAKNRVIEHCRDDNVALYALRGEMVRDRRATTAFPDFGKDGAPEHSTTPQG